jgi:Flp pilus assembly protein TadD
MSRLHLALSALGVCALLFVAYANHFHNGFHFDDTHAIVDNPALRDIHNIPRYFVDATTFSVLPLNQTYRPVLQTTLAIDLWLAGGYRPTVFQMQTFAWFVLQLVLMYGLFVTVADRASGDVAANRTVALIATSLYGLHPLCAETVNYIIQRGEILSAIGVIGAVLAYARFPQYRRFGLYLLPMVFGALAKPPALITPLLLAVYTLLFEGDDKAGRRAIRRHWATAIKAALPAVVTAIVLALWMQSRMPPTYASGATSPARYVLTQPFVTMRYVLLLIAPFDLNPDKDWPLVSGIADPRVWYGLVFVCAFIWLAARVSHRRETRPIAFGLWWFLLTLLPTAAMPLAEVGNDIRPFLPLAGLALAVSWTGYRWWPRLATDWRRRAAGAAVVAGVLIACAVGVHARNDVWQSDESLWYDVTLKSPTNGRGLMNYGLTRMATGDYTVAIFYFERALVYVPNYFLAHTNLGIAYGGVARNEEAEREFHEAIRLAPNDSRAHYFYGRWLRSIGRAHDAVAELRLATTLNPLDLVAKQELERATTDERGTPERFLALSLAAYQAKRYRECITFAEEALKLRPDYAEAYNNIAAGHIVLGEWDQAIAAARRAVELKPNLTLARGNLDYALARKAGRPVR